MSRKPSFILCAFVVLVILHSFLLAAWIRNNHAVPGIDNSIHLLHSLTCHYLLSDVSYSHLLQTLSISPYYPPFYPCASTVFYRMAGNTSLHAALFGNAAVLALLLSATFLFASALFDSFTALLSALLLSFYPMTLYLSRTYFLDLPLCFFVTAALYALYRSRHFSVSLYSILFGILSGLGMLTKWSFAFFICFPFLFVLYEALRSNRTTPQPRFLSNLVKCIVIFLFITSPWYIINGSSLAHTLRDGFYLDAGHDPSPRTMLFYVFYLKAFVYEQLGIYLSIVFLFACLKMFAHKNYSNADRYILFSLAAAYVIFTLVQNKDARFTAPYLPLVAILTARGLSFVLPPVKKAVLFVLLLLLCANTYVKFCPLPVHENWKLEEASRFLTEEIKTTKPLVVGVDSAYEKINMYSFQYYFFRTYFERKHYFPFVIQPPGTDGHASYDIIVAKRSRKTSGLKGFSIRKIFPLPDGEWLIMYFRNAVKI